MNNYSFNGSMSREVLESFLSRAVTAADLVNSDTLDDDLRMIGNIGAKFLGRASGVWDLEPDDGAHFQKSRTVAARVHEIDPDIILQTCIFEAIFKEVENIEIPDWVFKSFQLPIEHRTFRFTDMLFDSKPQGYIWDQNGGIPNIDKLETQLWFFYRAASYIDAGYEAIHMGQIHLYTADDTGFKKTIALFEKIRDYAITNARRGIVLLDAHTHGVNVQGRLLFDFHSMPYSRMPILDTTGDKLALVQEGFSEGGVTPSGWSCESLPMLMELDNWGGQFVFENDCIPNEQRAWKEWWGYDQIAWFASQDEESRNRFLEYTLKWTAVNNVNAYLQMPMRRGLGSCQIPMTAWGTGEMTASNCYQANTPGEGCPLGFGQEETIKYLWQLESDLRQKAGNPLPNASYGAEDSFDPETGIKLPSRVILYGSFQHHVGAFKNDSNSETTRMYYMGDGIYQRTFVLPFRGSYDYAVALYGTLSQTFSFDSYPRSGSSNKSTMEIEQDNTVVTFVYDFRNRSLTANMIEGL
ncbi:hypothetical protein Back11_15470 [Paenibacillus baekrokdamisoli]|uniref:Amylopullulanase X25 domain-containing protein n=1 Tax=Paenibacillus baekrokdamisoli TaxID=1712516 RepID=A0A3G9IPK8_9BACL|nr:hypothetical protein [Paenibacillus baekrokdamisoli]MBB3073251.1 hypothetical protein [Paenibacillus baekrokdamisoli]BBH20202.1 hypothetical protein Back11_15470 [Paenibacillus baekrokdamisoli]